ncbi:MAG: putative toxin-antitoxin system toxin component, PIN family [Candidatus Roizmanbacteria bacterium]|nr:putative toxin-antitoxin system toxin component, PIN family [Candidatus Roizmanbacteria bacterium]
MEKNSQTPIVFFNASVIIAGFISSTGGSAKLLQWTKEKKITGVISEIIHDEVMRKSAKTGFSSDAIKRKLFLIFAHVKKAPDKKLVKKFNNIVIDLGDSHVLASSIETKADFLVTLDKKHLLILTGKIEGLRIVSPKQLIEIL